MPMNARILSNLARRTRQLPGGNAVVNQVKNHPRRTAIAGAVAVGLPFTFPGAERSRRNQNDLVLRRLRTASSSATTGLSPHSTGGYTL